MFFVNEPNFDYRDPWAQPFKDRFRDLCAGSPRVAYFYENPDNSTFRYRVYNMIQVIRAQMDGASAAFFGNDDYAEFNRIVDASDVIVICRTRYNDHYNELVARAKQQGKRVLFDVDDLVFDTSYTHLVLKTLDQDFNHPEVWNFWFAYMGRLGGTLKMCDGAITTNRFLAQRISDFSGLPVFIVPNFMNMEQLDISDRIYAEKLASGFMRTDKIHVGYFSGTPTHNHDFSMAANALAELMEQDERINLLVVGFLDFKGELSHFDDRIQVYPLHDFVNLQRLMSLVEINMVPLLDNGFTNCKSELKYFEAAAVGTLSVATPIHTYANAIHDGRNGWLSNSIEWVDKLGAAVEAVDGNYADMAKAAHDQAHAQFAWYNQMPRIRKALFGDLAQADLAANPLRPAAEYIGNLHNSVEL